MSGIKRPTSRPRKLSVDALRSMEKKDISGRFAGGGSISGSDSLMSGGAARHDSARERERMRSSGGRISARKASTGSPRSPQSDLGGTNTHASIHGTAMLDVKVSRKQTESDLQMLANRVALLKIEEMRAKEKAEETKKRAKELQEIKKRNEETAQLHLSLNVQREMAIKATQARAAAEREERARKLEMSKTLINNSKKAAAKERKKESREAHVIVDKVRVLSAQEKHERAEQIKRSHEQARVKKERMREQQEKEAEERYLRELAEEEQRKRRAERMIQALQRQEEEMLNKLKKTQEMQNKAFGELVRSLES